MNPIRHDAFGDSLRRPSRDVTKMVCVAFYFDTVLRSIRRCGGVYEDVELFSIVEPIDGLRQVAEWMISASCVSATNRRSSLDSHEIAGDVANVKFPFERWCWWRKDMRWQPRTGKGGMGDSQGRPVGNQPGRPG